MKIVLDCNVLVAAGIKDGTCAACLREIIRNHQVFVTSEIVEEYREVIERPKFKKAHSNLLEIVEILTDIAEWISSSACSFQLPDPDDTIYLAAALEAKANTLITGNKKHFPLSNYDHVRILSPKEFLDICS
jgi:uncharacterized protein